ncbi:MAG: chromosome segregation protein SMC [Candidatus Krumholzibacteriota bacterium]|nr:chromosome segregation protein SMC [Candidatus Krumholzibacteriota bacterium]
MSLCRLELVGFKSFMNPVTLELKDGITAILGPNGCGKTNIVDAVRWVLGEQSARQLRSNKMENVIFNGTQVRKPTGYAQVNLTVNNERGSFPLEYSEITITRKVYRSGISEYFINKIPCRLKDIKELFADTGTGSHSYAVIEQEMIDYVLNDSHGERRQMFEEASGIVKYRMRREEAKRKLKLTESDLIRLDDILEELGKNVRSLRYQMGKAKRYRKVSDKIMHWGLIQLRRTLSRFLNDKREAEAELVKSSEVSQQGGLSLGESEKKVEAEKIQLVDDERKSSRLQNLRYEIRRKVQGAEEKIIQLTERRREGERRIERDGLEIEEAQTRLLKIGVKTVAVENEAEATAEKIDEVQQAIRSLGGRFEEITLKIERLQSELIDLKQTQLDFLQDQVRVKSSQEHYEIALKELDLRSSQLRERVIELELETASLGADREEKERGLRESLTHLAGREKEREDLSRQEQEGESRLFQGEKLLSEKKTELARLISRRDLYARMKDNFEGFPGGARYILQKEDSRVRGPLAELLKIDDEYRPALESVLAGIMDGVVIDNFSSALELIQEILDNGLGGIRIFVEEGPALNEGDTLSGVPGLRGPLSSLIRVGDNMRTMVENLLGTTYLFDNPQDALNFVNSSQGDKHNAVSLSGVFFCPGKGIYFSGKPGEELSLLGRAEEIEKLEEAVGVLQRETSDLENRCENDRNQKTALRAKIGALDEEILGIREKVAGQREKRQEIEHDYIMKKEKCSLLMKSLEELEYSRVETISKLEEAKLALAMQQETSDVTETLKMETELASLSQNKMEMEASLTERKVELASLQGTLDKQKEELRGLHEMEKQFRNIVEQRNQEIASAQEELGELAATLEGERGVVKQYLEEEGACQKELDELMEILEQKRAVISEMEKELRSKKEERERIFTQINEVKIRLSSIDTRINDLVERAREIYGEDLSCYLEGEERPLSPEEEAITPEMLEKEKAKLESLGPVNLAAVEEYEDKKKRLDFLEGQRDDLLNAKNELEEAITKINRKARSLFLQTFSVVKEYFSEIFEVLFEGGEASLSLGEGSDPLEAEIVISARPKGKKLQDISLLSGGERALTAMALLFALYKAKPSPFCMFDEVDAPLDDANIQRFVKMLKKFSRETQFIIITHNKRTMEAANTLFGITMEEKGVSRIVSVNLAEIDEVLEKRKAPAREMVEAPLTSN